MKVALVHDYLNQYGGAERVLEVLMEIFPEAPIYTILHDPAQTNGRFKNKIVKTSFLDFPLARRKHRPFIPLMPLAAASLNLGSQYDLVISDTAGFAKGIRYNPATTRHISYIYTPLRYAWEAEEYLPAILSPLQLAAAEPMLDFLRWWDRRVAQKPDQLIAISKFIAGKIKTCYGREAAILHPPVDTDKFFYQPAKTRTKKLYYLAAGRLLHYKKFDLVIEAFAKLQLPLKIVGTGPERNNLEQKALNLNAKNVEFLGEVSDEQLRALYSGAKAFIFPQVEDFGLVAAEAMACGTPVIAYADGGALEIVEDGKTGLFFKQQSLESLMEAVSRLEKTKFDRRRIVSAAQRFSKEKFIENLKQFIIQKT